MSDRITNAELKEVHSYLDKINDERFCTLMHKLLATFNFLIINGAEWKEKSKKSTVLEVELIEKKQEIINLNKRIEKKQDIIEELVNELEKEQKNSERYYNAYKTCVEREERMKANIKRLRNEVNNRGNTKNKEK